MHWGEGRSPGHYLDLSSAVLGVIASSVALRSEEDVRAGSNLERGVHGEPEGRETRMIGEGGKKEGFAKLKKKGVAKLKKKNGFAKLKKKGFPKLKKNGFPKLKKNGFPKLLKKNGFPKLLKKNGFRKPKKNT